MKRYRRPVTKPGQLRVYYGKDSDGEGPDIVLSWGGDGADKCDSNLLHMYLCSKRPRPTYGEERLRVGNIAWDDSLIDELKKRGYDLTTLKFSIERLPVKETT